MDQPTSDQSTSLEFALQKVSLDGNYWTGVLKSACGITESDQLRFADESTFNKLKEHVRHNWEVNAIKELLGVKESFDQRLKVKKDDEENRQKEALKMLSELKEMRHQGISESDASVKSKVDELRQVMKIPNEFWEKKCTNHSVYQIIDKLSNQLGEINEPAGSHNDLTPTELIKRASGGLALKGFLVTADPEKSIEPCDNLIEAPIIHELLSPASSEMDNSVEFSSRRQSDRFHRSLDTMGHSMAASAKGGRWGFQVEAGFSESHQQESEEESESHNNESFLGREMYTCVPTAVCKLDKRKLKLSEGAQIDLKELETIIQSSDDQNLISERSQKVLNKYGSHVNVGNVELGGIYRWRATCLTKASSDTQKDKAMVQDALSGFVTMSYSVFGITAGGSLSGTEVKNHASVVASYDESELSHVTLNIIKKGGPQGVTSLPVWKMGLLKWNDTWAIINRGSSFDRDFVSIWELIEYNADQFSDSRKLSDVLKRTWRAKNGLQVHAPKTEQLLDIFRDFNDFLSRSLQEWNKEENFSSNACDHLSELYKKVYSCSTETGEIKFWVTKLQIDNELNNFLQKVMDVKDQLPVDDLVNIRDCVKSIIKLADTNEFPLRNKILLWIAEQEKQKKYIPSLIQHNDIEDITSFISAIENTLLPEMHTQLTTQSKDSVDSSATRDIALAIQHLRENMESSERHLEKFLLYVGLRKFSYDAENMAFKVLISAEILKCFLTTFRKLFDEFENYRRRGNVEVHAFLIASLLDVLTHGSDEYQCDEQEFRKSMSEMKTEIPTPIKEMLSKFLESPPVNWNSMLATLNQLKNGNLSILEEKKVDIPELDMLFARDRGAFSDMDIEDELDIPGSNSSVENLLQQLALEEYFPHKISLQNVMAIKSIHQRTTMSNLPWKFLEKLIMLDCNGRDHIIKQAIPVEDSAGAAGDSDEEFSVDKLLNDVCSSDNDSLMLNPLDIFLAIYSCCDLILQQVLLQKMFTCRLALPFVSPQLSTGSQSLFTLWGLRNIIVECKSKQSCIEASVVKQDMKTVSVVRICRPALSKSALLNSTITDLAHHTFFCRESPLGDEERQFANGLVEAQWFLPSGKATEFTDDVTMFLNLRGDALKHTDRVSFLDKVSDAMIFIIDVRELENLDVHTLMKPIHVSDSKVILLLTIQDPATFKKESLRKALDKYVCNAGKPKAVITGWKDGKTRTIGDLKHEIRKNIMKLMKEKVGKSIEYMSDLARDCGIIVDEDSKTCSGTRKLAEEVIYLIGDAQTHKSKQEMLPMQGENLHKLSELLKQRARSGRRKKKSNLIQDMARLQDEMTELRKEQFKHCKNLTGLMKIFMKNLVQVIDTAAAPLFLQWLKIFLDEKSRNTLPALRNTYHKLWTELNNSKQEAGPQNISVIRSKLDKAEKTLTEAYFGLEHLLREMAQIFETAKESKVLLSEQAAETIQKLPMVAAKLLMSGQPIEIMNGDAAYVPLTWVKDILSSLKEVAGDKKLFVISVLGVQSSGKSTLLNTMFGLQFAASAGRCTRGAFMQLLPVKDEQSNYDFALIIDTEGLRAPELGQGKHSHDNELATFVIGLGDVTIINIKGENMAEMTDILQIAVHAFLRMKICNGNIQMQRSCVFIHQNVPAVNAKEKMQQGCQKLQENLDKMTIEACATENISDVHSFNQVIDFDRQKHVWYFSDLWHGDPPMASANTGYTEKIQEVKNCLLYDLTKTQTFLRFSDMRLRINDLWNGVLSDDFVFSFRNSLAAKAYNNLERTFFSLTWKVENQVNEWLDQQVFPELDSCKSDHGLEECCYRLTRDMEEKVSFLKENAKNDLENFFENNSMSGILIDWKVDSLNSLSNDCSEFLNKAKREVYEKKEYLRINLLQKLKQAEHKDEILMKAKELADEMKGKFASDDEITRKFNSLWIQWANELASRVTEQPIVIADEVERLLFKYMEKDSIILRGELKSYPLSKESNINQLRGSMTVADIEKSFVSVKKSFPEKYIFVWKSSDGNKMKSEAARVINEIFYKIDVFLNDLVKQDVKFRAGDARKVIEYIINGVNDHNDQSRNECPFTLLPNCKVRMAVRACRYAVKIFERIQYEYENKHNPRKKLEENRKTTEITFRNLVKQATKEVIAADLFICSMENLIKDVVASSVQTKIVNETVLNFSSNKFTVMTHIMDTLADNGNFAEFCKYINCSRDYAQEWLTSFMNEKLFSTKDRRYENLAASEIHIIKESLRKSIVFATESIKEKSNPNIHEWCSTFRSALTHLHVSEDSLKHVMKESVTDFGNFQVLLIERLDKLDTDLLETFKSQTADSIRWSDTTPYSQVFEKLWGCEEQCPFCNEPCKFTDKNHCSSKSVSHSCIQHRVPGVRGTIWNTDDSRNGKLVLESCNFLVQTTTRFRCGVSKFECRKSGKCSTTGNEYVYHDYSQYKTYLPKWEIAPSPDMASSKFWMWFMATYKHQLLDYYKNAKCPDVPSEWDRITKQEAKDSLRQI